MMKDVVVVIPVYLPEPSEQEKINLHNNIEKLSAYDICFVCPIELDMTFYNQHYPMVQIRRFCASFFKGLQGYNQMMLSSEFYNAFSEYRYICICQTDVLILRDGNCLDEFMVQGYDYYGAPWFPAHRIYPFASKLTLKARLNLFLIRKEVQVGNGGFSLRKTQSVLTALSKNKELLDKWKIYEDYFFAYIGKYANCGFCVAPVDVAKRFALETDSRRIVMEERIIPVGLHAPLKYFPEIYSQNINDLLEIYK